ATVDPAPAPPSHSSDELTSLARSYTAHEQQLIARLRTKVQQLHDGVAIWGAGAKGVTLANLVDPARQWIKCIFDLNPNKQGRYLPGTGHPIVGPSALADCKVAHAILTNPNYRAETHLLLTQLNLNIELIDFMQELQHETYD